MSLFYSITIANSLSALFLTVASLMASGFFRSYDRMPEFVQYISYASVYKYSTEVRGKGRSARCGGREKNA